MQEDGRLLFAVVMLSLFALLLLVIGVAVGIRIAWRMAHHGEGFEDALLAVLGSIRNRLADMPEGHDDPSSG